MMSKQNMIAASILCLGTMLGTPRIQRTHEREQQIPATKRTDYCSLVAQSAKYDHHVFETEGIYRRGGEIRGFYSLSCAERKDSAWVDYSEDLREHTPPPLYKRMEKLLDADGRAGIVAVLRFDGPKKVKIAPGTPPALAAAMRDFDSRYGHMNQFKYRVVLLKIIRVDSVPPDAPWPTRDKGNNPSKP